MTRSLRYLWELVVVCKRSRHLSREQTLQEQTWSPACSIILWQVPWWPNVPWGSLQCVQTGSLPVSLALTPTLVTSVSTKCHPCKPCWFLSLALRPQQAVASWQFGDNCLDLQSVAFLKTILLQSELSHPLWLFWWQWRAGSRSGLSSPPVPPLLCTVSLSPPLIGSAGPTDCFIPTWSVTLRVTTGGNYLTSFHLSPH